MKRIKKISLTVGISAFNEAKNLPFLLHDLSNQKLNKINLEKIVLISDGSSDETAKIGIEKMGDMKNLIAIDHKTRKGLAARLNEVFSVAKSDIVILLNADIRVDDVLFLEKLCQPIVDEVASLTSCRIDALSGKNLLERSLKTSMNIKNRVFEEYRNGDNIFACHGTARAFSRSFYRKFRFTHSVGEDAYSYLFASYNHFPFMYVKNTRILFKLPTTMKDHKKQSQRYVQSKNQFISEFGELYMKKMYYLPNALCFRSLLREAMQNPIGIIIYSLVSLIVRIQSTKPARVQNTWDIATSSKTIN